MSDRNAAPSPSQARSGRPSNGAMGGLVESFDAMALAAGKKLPSTPARMQQSRDGGFIGGFHPGFTPSPVRPSVRGSDKPLPHPHAFPGYPNVGLRPQQERTGPQRAPGALPQPPRMPMPHHTHTPQSSRTMQYALGGLSPPRSRLDATIPLTPPPPVRTDRPSSDPSIPTAASLGVYTPQPAKLAPPPVHRRAKSDPPSPVSARPGTVQCSGMTRAGEQCTRQCKQTLGADEDVFCHQHMKKINEEATMFDKKTNTHAIKFADWIPDYLQESTKASLRSEMEKPRSSSDVPGYIYTFEILDPTTPRDVHLKVGRATNLNRRIDQWGKQCGSKEQVLRGFWPEPERADQASFMKGRIKAGAKGAWCHRLERLVHIELADLATNRPYLDPKFPNNPRPPSPGKGTPKKGGDKPDIKRCPDCNTAHREIFTFERVKEGRYRGREWELIVKPVIEKWGGFVEAYV